MLSEGIVVSSVTALQGVERRARDEVKGRERARRKEKYIDSTSMYYEIRAGATTSSGRGDTELEAPRRRLKEIWS